MWVGVEEILVNVVFYQEITVSGILYQRNLHMKITVPTDLHTPTYIINTTSIFNSPKYLLKISPIFKIFYESNSTEKNYISTYILNTTKKFREDGINLIVRE